MITTLIMMLIVIVFLTIKLIKRKPKQQIMLTTDIKVDEPILILLQVANENSSALVIKEHIPKSYVIGTTENVSGVIEELKKTNEISLMVFHLN